MKRNSYLIALFIFTLAVGFYETAFAEETTQNDKWQFGAEIYLWGASVGAQTGSGSDIDVDFDDLLKNLNLGFMGAFGAQKGKWSFLADILYLDVEGDTTVGPGIGPGVKLDGTLTGWIVTPLVGYNLLDAERVRLDVVGGARYLYLKTDLKLGRLRSTDPTSFWDGVLGIKGHVNLTEKWYLPFYADIGTGQSKLTWQALGAIGYRFKWCDVIAGYRYLRWDFDSSETLDDLNMHGPYAGVKFVF